MKILLFGSSGTVGTAIEDACARKNIDCLSPGHGDVEITDVQKVRSIIASHEPDVVINSVAIVGINPCEERPDVAFAVNSTAVRDLAQICQNNEITLVQASTHAVFDGTKDDYYTEDDLPNPTGIYSASKYLSERFAANLCKKHYVVRFPTLYGRRRNQALGFVDKVLQKMTKGEDLKIADDKIDSPTYTFDLAEALISLLEDNYPFGVYHIANSGRVSYFDFVMRIRELLKSDVNIMRAKDSEFKALGYKPLKTAMKSIKLKPMRNWGDALCEYISREIRRKPHEIS